MGHSNYTVCLYDEERSEALRKIVQFFWPSDSVFRPESTLQAKDRPEGRPPTFLFLKDEEAIGHISTIPVRVSCGSCIAPAYWVVGFMVLPDHRNGMVGPLLIKKVNETLDLAMTLHVEDNVLRIFKGLGWKHLGLIPQYVRILHPSRLLNNLQIKRMSFLSSHRRALGRYVRSIAGHPVTRWAVAGAYSAGLNIWLAANQLRLKRGHGDVLEEKEFDPGYDELWKRVGPKFEALIVRDRAYLVFRYGRQMHKYRLLACRQNDCLLGYCILKIKSFSKDARMGNARIGTIVDCLFDPSDLTALQSLIDGAVRLCETEGVEAIFCTASYLPLQRRLAVNGFIKLPGNLNFAYRDRLNTLSTEVPLDSWHLMRGDSDAASNF